MKKSENNLKIVVQKNQTTDLIILAWIKFQGDLENAKLIMSNVWICLVPSTRSLE